jgi:hypothetical protein
MFLVYYSSFSPVFYSILFLAPFVILLVSIILMVAAVAQLVRHFSVLVLVALFLYFSLGVGLPVLFALAFLLAVFPIAVGPSFLVVLLSSFVPVLAGHFL